MENTLVVLLLLCALSVAEGAPSQNNPDLSDLYTQLGDMKAQLAEDRLMIQQLQKDKEELEAKLKDQDSQLEPIKEKFEEQVAKVEELEKQSGEVATIKAQLQERQVAFFVTYVEKGGGDYGKYNSEQVLVFRNVVLNIGGAYSASTGFFTAPVKGAYHFDFYIYGHSSSNYRSAAMLVMDGKNIAIAYQHLTSGGGGISASNGATLLLDAGNVVAVHLWADSRIFDNDNHHCTFNGHLLFTLP